MELIRWPGIPEHSCTDDLKAWGLENQPVRGVVVKCDCGLYYKYLTPWSWKRAEKLEY